MFSIMFLLLSFFLLPYLYMCICTHIYIYIHMYTHFRALTPPWLRLTPLSCAPPRTVSTQPGRRGILRGGGAAKGRHPRGSLVRTEVQKEDHTANIASFISLPITTLLVLLLLIIVSFVWALLRVDKFLTRDL